MRHAQHAGRLLSGYPPGDYRDALDDELPDHGAALAWFEEQRDNLVAAFRLASARRLADVAGRLANALGGFFSSRGSWSAWEEAARLAVDVTRNATDQAVRAGALYGLGDVCRRLHQLDEALDACQRGVAISRELGDRVGEARGLAGLGAVHSKRNQPRRAADAYERSQWLFEKLGDREGEAEALAVLGAIYSDLHRTKEAVDAYRKSSEIFGHLGALHCAARTLIDLAELEVVLSDFDDARTSLDRARKIYAELKDRHEEASTLNIIGIFNVGQQNFDEALNTFRESLDISRDLREREAEGYSLIGLGDVYRAMRDFYQARDAYQRAIWAFREGGSHALEAEAFLRLGSLHEATDHLSQAMLQYEGSLAVYQRIGDRENEGLTLARMGHLARVQGQRGKAHSYFRQSLRVFQELKSPARQAAVLEALADLRREQGRMDDAAAYDAQRAIIDPSMTALEPWPGDDQAVPMEEDNLYKGIEAYFNAPTELAARIALRDHPELMTRAAQKVARFREGLSPTEIGVRRPVAIARFELLMRCQELGVIGAFTEAFRAGRLPFALAPADPEPAESVSNLRESAPELHAALADWSVALEEHAATNDLEPLARAITMLEQAIDSPKFAELDAQARASLLRLAAYEREMRFQLTADIEDLDTAIAQRRRGLHEMPSSAPGLYVHYGEFGEVLYQRYHRSEDVFYLDYGIAALMDGIAITPVNSPRLHGMFSALGNGIWYRYQLTDNLEELENAGLALLWALENCPVDAPERPGVLNNAADVYLHMMIHIGRSAQLTKAREYADKSVELARESVATTPRDSEDLPRHLSMLARVLNASRVVSDSVEKLDEAVAIAERAVRLTSPGSSELPGREGEFAHLLRLKAETLRPSEKLPASPTEYFRRSCTHGLQTDASAARASARSWGEWAAKEGRWNEAAEAYGYGLTAMAQVFQSQRVRAHKELQLQATQDLPGEAALALAKARDIEGAVIALERGRALLLTEALERRAVDLEGLGQAGKAELADRYRLLTSEATELEAGVLAVEELDSTLQPVLPVVERRLDRLVGIRRELGEIEDEIHRLLGVTTSVEAASFSDIAAMVIEEEAIVYLAATQYGGVGITLTADSAPRAIFLPVLTQDALKLRVDQFLRAYGRRRIDPHDWFDAVDEVTGWLWPAAMGPVLEALPGVRRALVVPVGLLGLLPLHAAWCEDDSAVVGRRYALDSFAISYAPTVGAVRHASELRRTLVPDRVLAVVDPQPSTAARLPFATQEAAFVLRSFSDGKPLSRESARRDTVFPLLSEYPVVHFACHGFADPQEPLNSALMLARDEGLTLRNLLGSRFEGLRLVVLSACETAVINAVVPNEAIGLQTGFLQAGAAGIVGSLWAVPDKSTAMLMAEFYRLWRGAQLRPARALQRAQQWVRDTTTAEKMARYPDLYDRAHAEGSMNEMLATRRAQNHPAYWAAFTCIGG